MLCDFDIRRCSAEQLATDISKLAFQTTVNHKGFSIQPTASFQRKMSFTHSCQAWIAHEEKPVNVHQWKGGVAVSFEIRPREFGQIPI
ncbi:unnamed protein product, partial [Adineta ricciae]